jgi:hypothetical protein
MRVLAAGGVRRHEVRRCPALSQEALTEGMTIYIQMGGNPGDGATLPLTSRKRDRSTPVRRTPVGASSAITSRGALEVMGTVRTRQEAGLAGAV